VVVALVGSVLHVGENSRAPGAAFIGLVDPVVGGYFKLAIERDRPLNGTDFPVVCGHLVGCGERENDLQIGGKRSPIDGVAKFDAVAGVSGREPHGLHELRALAFA
jgi:hypothetical protein